MKIDYSLITSILDTDLYKLTQGQVVFYDFPEANVEYEFFNRGKNKFPEGFAKELRNQIQMMSLYCKMSHSEHQYLIGLNLFKKGYVEWLKNYEYNPDEVLIEQIDGELQIIIRGPWHRVILWEVPLMALISELYFLLTGQKPSFDWSDRIVNKAKKLSCNSAKDGIPHNWIDMGTRRRFSMGVQDFVVCAMKNYPGFLGTSNPFLAKKYGVKAFGSIAHEFYMGMSAKYGVRLANIMTMKHWSEFYRGELGTVLPDTFTTDVFLRDFDGYWARLYDIIRQDSGNPHEWMDNKVVPHYAKLKINTITKTALFSDSLNTDSYMVLSNKYRNNFKVVGGIGTHLTNDVGVTPLNIVVKLTKADFGQGMVNVVKLSDHNGKHTGHCEAVRKVKEELNIV